MLSKASVGFPVEGLSLFEASGISILFTFATTPSIYQLLPLTLQFLLDSTPLKGGLETLPGIALWGLLLVIFTSPFLSMIVRFILGTFLPPLYLYSALSPGDLLNFKSEIYQNFACYYSLNMILYIVSFVIELIGISLLTSAFNSFVLVFDALMVYPNAKRANQFTFTLFEALGFDSATIKKDGYLSSFWILTNKFKGLFGTTQEEKDKTSSLAAASTPITTTAPLSTTTTSTSSTPSSSSRIVSVPLTTSPKSSTSSTREKEKRSNKTSSTSSQRNTRVPKKTPSSETPP